MSKSPRRPKPDINQIGKMIVDTATSEMGVNKIGSLKKKELLKSKQKASSKKQSK